MPRDSCTHYCLVPTGGDGSVNIEERVPTCGNGHLHNWGCVPLRNTGTHTVRAEFLLWEMLMYLPE